MEQSSSREAARCSASEEILRPFIEHEGSLPCSQETATEP
jgi:hypothetical protein